MEYEVWDMKMFDFYIMFFYVLLKIKIILGEDEIFKLIC